MNGQKDKSTALLKLLRGPKEAIGLKVIKVKTTEPDPITFVFEGTPLALDIDIFEIPVNMYPLRSNDRLLVFPIVGEGDAQRWAALEKINGGVTLATMAGPSSLKIAGVGKTYGASDLIIPPYFAVSNSSSRYTDSDTDTLDDGTRNKTTNYSDYYLQAGDIRPLNAGDKVSIAPTLEGGKIKYVILERY
jgi:hypothetical protein